MPTNIETQSIATIKSFQERLLRRQITYLANHSPFYTQKFKNEKVVPASIQTLEDLAQISPTTKDDIQLQNEEFYCIPKSKILDYSTTSGTLGSPVTVGLSKKDLDRLALNEMLSLSTAGVVQGDIVQLMTTMDRRFMAGLAYSLGLRRLEAGLIRVGSGLPPLQWDSILRYSPKYLIGVPSFLLKIIEYAESNDIDYLNCSIEGVICIGESLRTADLRPNKLAQRINDKWPIKLFSTYASTEMSAAFTECSALCGGHHRPELIITEILNDEGSLVEDGELGELVITTLDVETMPLLRFKTGDLVRKHISPCSCGRNTYRIGPVEGRKQHMIKYKGTTLYPPAMQDAISHFKEIKLHLIEVKTSEVGTDEITLIIQSENQSEDFTSRLKNYFKSALRVTPHIVFESEKNLQKLVFDPMSRKPITFLDKR